MNSKPLPQIGYLLGDSIDNVSNLIANYELDILNIKGKATLAAISSPIKRPSLILTGPGRN